MDKARTFWQLTADSTSLTGVIPLKFSIDAFNCIGTAQIRSPFCGSSKLGNQFSELFNLYLLEVPFGPYSQDLTRENILNWAKYSLKLAKTLSMMSISITPPYYLYMDTPHLSEIYDNALTSLNFKPVKMHTIILDLRASKETLFGKLKSETRRKVRRSFESGITIQKLTDPEHIRQWQTLKNRTDKKTFNRIKHIATNEPTNFEYYVVIKDGKPLAWQGVKWGKDVAILEGNAVSRSKANNKIFANYALQWFIIEKALDKGIKWIDWVGAEPDSNDPKMDNIMNFKLSWGGSLHNYFVYYYTTNKLKKSFFSTLKESSSFLKKIKFFLTEKANLHKTS